MSRYTRANKPPVENSKYTPAQLNTISSVGKLLSHFIVGHQKKAMEDCWRKLFKHYKKKQRGIRYFIIKLGSLSSKKRDSYLKLAFSNLFSNKIHCQTEDLNNIRAQREHVKNKAASLIGIIHSKLTNRKRKQYFQLFAKKAKQYSQGIAYKIAHFNRIFNGIKKRQIKDTVEKLKFHRERMKQKIIKLRRIDNFIGRKRKMNFDFVFRKLKLANIKAHPVRAAPKSPPQNRRKQVTQPSVQEPDHRQIQIKNRKAEQELQKLKRENEAIIEGYKSEIEKLEAEQEGLRFNSDLLDQGNRDLEIQIIQRQKQGRKRMSNRDLWEQIYQNFLFMVTQYKDKVLPREKVLEFLETPLVPLNLNIETISEQNRVMQELVEEYRKFYGEKDESSIQGQNLLPYDILNLKNKFFFAASQCLLSHGIGNPNQIEQLKSDLETLIKKSS